MPGCSLLSVAAPSTKVRAPYLQQIDETGFKSLQSRSEATAASAEGPLSPPADFAWRERDWLALPYTGADLLARLPLADAIRLAALVGAGRMTWPAVYAALDAMIKLAAEGASERGMWQAAKQDGEAEIWARYHAQCDSVFAGDAADSDPGTWSHEQVWNRERILDHLRSVRDRALAAARRRPTSCAIALKSSSAPAETLTPLERDALERLDATGFTGSQDMMAAIDGIVADIATAA